MVSFRIATEKDAAGIHACGAAWLPGFVPVNDCVTYMQAHATQRIVVAELNDDDKASTSYGDTIVSYALCTLFPKENPVRMHVYSQGSLVELSFLDLDYLTMVYVQGMAREWGAGLVSLQNHVESFESIAACRRSGFVIVEEVKNAYEYEVVKDPKTQDAFIMQVVVSDSE